MKTKFIKVSVDERLPEKTGFYYVEKYSTKLDKVQVSRYTIESMEFQQDDVKFWLDPVPDREDEMREILKRAKLQLEADSKRIGSSPRIVIEIEQLLKQTT